LEREREKKMQEARKEQSSLPSSLTCHNVRTGWLLAGAGFVFPSGLVGSFFLLLLVKQNRGLAAEHWWWWLRISVRQDQYIDRAGAGEQLMSWGRGGRSLAVWTFWPGGRAREREEEPSRATGD